ncbi:MAG TPA: HlyD family efflux transporter periplasmic adaptor subunit [Sphingomonas sp.]|nr:HlyD family efflux transporter periplasmic adaptor subunit [Sphingomonas sp.]
MLFRMQVIEHKRLRRFGRAVPLYMADTLPIVALLLIVTIGAGLWLASGSYARTATVDGWVVPDGPAARIVPAQRGTLVALDVREGQRVRRGDRLGTIEIQSANALSADPAAESLAIVTRERAQIGAQRRLATSANTEERRRLADAARQLRLRIAALDRQIALQRARVASSRKSFAIIGDARQKNYVSRIDYENQRRQHLDEEARLQELTAERAALGGQYADNQAAIRQAPIDLGRTLADLSARGMELDQRRLDIAGTRAIVLTAPFNGQVAALQARTGQAVGPDRPVMVVLGDDARLDVELFAPSRAIGFARVGERVRLMYDAFPYQQFGTFGGTITRISHTALAPDEIAAPVSIDEPAYRVRVRLDAQTVQAFGGTYPIQPGMTLGANLILERQSFLDWLLAPIRAIRART